MIVFTIRKIYREKNDKYSLKAIMAPHTLVKHNIHQVQFLAFRITSDMANAFTQADVVCSVGSD